jgi:hypothetical protein
VEEDADADEGFMGPYKVDFNLWQCMQQLDIWLLRSLLVQISDRSTIFLRLVFAHVKVPLLAAGSGGRGRRLATVEEDADADEGFMITDKVDFNLWQCMRQLDFWLLTFSASTTTGIALAFINNASAIVESLHGNQTVVVSPLVHL